MGTINKDIAPIDDLNRDSEGIDVVYHWSPKLAADDANSLSKKIMDDLNDRIWMKPTLSLRGVKDEVISGITSYFPNPLFLTPTNEALCEFRDMTIAVINYFIKDANKLRTSNDMDKLKHVDRLTPDDLVRIVYGYYEVVNWAYSMSEVDSGVCMAFSKDEKRDPDGRFIPLDTVVNAFASEILSSDYDTKKILNNMASNNRTKIHICDPRIENRNKYLKNCTPYNNGVLVPELYKDMKRLLTYREAYTDYDLYLPQPIAANFIYNQENDVNAVFESGAASDGGLFPQIPAPVMIDGFDISKWFYEMFGYSPVLLKTIWAMLLAILRPFNSDYDRAFFLMDSGVGSTGKSTLLDLIVQMLGEICCFKLSLSDMANKNNTFALEKLAALAIYFVYSHENDPKDYHEKIANFKELCTGDPVNVNRKNKMILTRIFRGRMVHAFNRLFVKTSDNTESFYRRLLPVPFVKTIDNGNGEGEIPRNKKIRSAWVKRQDVIDWVATEAVRLNIEEVPLSTETLSLIEDMQEANNTVLKFVNTWVNTMTQSWFKIDWLYPAFVEFCRRTGNKNSAKMSSDIFETEVKNILDKKTSQWMCSDKVTNVNQYHIPLMPNGERPNGIILVGCDGVYSGLDYINNDKNHDQYDTAHKGIIKMYRDNKPGSVRNVYYRKPYSELENLIKQGETLIHAEYCEEKLDPAEICDMLNSGTQFVAPKPFDQITPKANLKTIRDPNYESREKTYAHIANRIDKLMKGA